MEFDHLFICVPGAASEAELLVDAGFTEGSRNQHPGQGTANRRFFFKNAFLELLYIDNLTDLGSSLTAPTRLKERFISGDSVVSPFGVCFRPSAGQAEASGSPFRSMVYQPEYLPPHLHVDIADSPLTEPMWFYLSFGSRPDLAPSDRRETFEHRCGVSEITAVKITRAGDGAISEVVQAIRKMTSSLSLQFDYGSRPSDEHVIEIEFDQHRQQQQQDFRPRLPLVCRW